MLYSPTPHLCYYHTQYLHHELKPHCQNHLQITPQNNHFSLFQPHYHSNHNNYHTIRYQCPLSNRTHLYFATRLDLEVNFSLDQNCLHPELHPITPKL